MTELKIEPAKVTVFFLSIVLALSFLNGALLALNFPLEESSLEGFVEYFDFDIEGNIPTLYSALATFVCAALLALIARINRDRTGGKPGYWFSLAILFAFLAIDEGTAIHEELSDFLEQYMAAEGPLYFLWVIPYGIAAAALGVTYLKFVWDLPAATRIRFIAAGLLFLGGALGVEMLSAIAADRHGYDSASYTMLYSAEEICEMLGIVLFIRALLHYIADVTGGLTLRLEPTKRSVESASYTREVP